ncbi:MAG: hypothetical protein ACJ786_24530 [Catenulispora sp.]
MSSSGLIYAGIVGAWAVYLVPVWLRREEQLNEAREKARYAAAIRTLGRSERFEKKVLGAEAEALAATGTDGAMAPRAGDSRLAGAQPKKSDREQGQSAKAAAAIRKPAGAQADARAAAPATQKTKTSAAAQSRKGVTARLPHHQNGQRATKPGNTAIAASAARRRGILLMRRRRVVAFLFTLATFGALVSAVLGLDYAWAMLAPAALFSGYIVYIRRDERQRAKERYRRRQAVLAAERRRERQRTAEQRGTASGEPVGTAAAAVRSTAVTEPETTVWRPKEPPQEYRRAANG